jgi:hypothetical protein
VSALAVVGLTGWLSADRALAELGPILKPNLTADPPGFVKNEELTWEGQKRLLMRFNGYIRNQGPGRLEVRGRRESALEPMHVYQRLYREGATEVHGLQPEEEYEEQSLPEAELVFDTDDGHSHFHVQDIAHYSLWNRAQTEEVAPAQKVGFCLTDSEHVEAQGPSTPFYADEAERRFCDHLEPEALTVWEGISAGWQDAYYWKVALQWVDISDVAPGEYWLREDVDPRGLLIESGTPMEAAKHAYSTSWVTVPGYDAVEQSDSDEAGEPVTITLTSRAFGVSGEPKYVIAAGPHHGTLGEVEGGEVRYTPEPGYSGSDTFTFYAENPGSEYPLTPVDATVSLGVSAATTTTTTTTTGSTTAATSTAVTTTTSTAPRTTPTTSTTTSTAATSKPGSSGDSRGGDNVAGRRRPLSDLEGFIQGDSVIVRARAGIKGRLWLGADGGRHRLGRCVAFVLAGQLRTCRIPLPQHVTRDQIVVWGMLRSGPRVTRKHHRLTGRAAIAPRSWGYLPVAAVDPLAAVLGGALVEDAFAPAI